MKQEGGEELLTVGVRISEPYGKIQGRIGMLGALELTRYVRVVLRI